MSSCDNQRLIERKAIYTNGNNIWTLARHVSYKFQDFETLIIKTWQ